MRYITEIGLTSRFFQAKLAYQLVYHKNSGTLPLRHAQSVIYSYSSIMKYQKPALFIL